MDDSQFSVSLLDLDIGRGGFHPKGIVVSRVHDHDGYISRSLGSYV